MVEVGHDDRIECAFFQYPEKFRSMVVWAEVFCGGFWWDEFVKFVAAEMCEKGVNHEIISKDFLFNFTSFHVFVSCCDFKLVKIADKFVLANLQLFNVA